MSDAADPQRQEPPPRVPSQGVLTLAMLNYAMAVSVVGYGLSSTCSGLMLARQLPQFLPNPALLQELPELEPVVAAAQESASLAGVVAVLVGLLIALQGLPLWYAGRGLHQLQPWGRSVTLLLARGALLMALLLLVLWFTLKLRVGGAILLQGGYGAAALWVLLRPEVAREFA